MLLTVPLVMILYKLSALPGAESMRSLASFESLPHDLRTRTVHLLFAPVGALVVVVVRLTLGIRVLGPFRSVLLAMAFQVTGAAIGLAFYALVIGTVALFRRTIKRWELPYFGRSAAMLTCVAVIIVAAMLAGLALGLASVERVVYFPLVVLTLAGEAFGVAWRREGRRSAVWRAGATAGAALVITGLSLIPAFQIALVRFPELLIAVLAAIILVSRFFNLRLFQRFNPSIRKARRARAKPVQPRTTSGAGKSEHLSLVHTCPCAHPCAARSI